MKIPKVFPFYPGTSDEFPENEFRSWTWMNYRIRMHENIGDKTFDDYTGAYYLKRFREAISMWRKIISCRNMKYDNTQS